MSEFVCPKCGAKLQVSAQKEEAKKTVSLEEAKALFLKDLADMLSFEEGKDYIIIKPRQYLGSENFAKIASIVRVAGGEYISAGKESHFRIGKKGSQ